MRMSAATAAPPAPLRSACSRTSGYAVLTCCVGNGHRVRHPSEGPIEDVGGDRGGAGAPSVGVLMELVAAVRCPDGRLIVLAYGMGRLRVGHFEFGTYISVYEEVLLAPVTALTATTSVCSYGMGRLRVG